MTWQEELASFLAAARGDVAVFLCLAALRRVENGGPGREMGVLMPEADTFEKQVHIARNTIRNNEKRAQQLTTGITVRDGATGLYTDAFLTFFSHTYAPIGVANDPHGLNVHHAPNLRAIYGGYAARVLMALAAL